MRDCCGRATCLSHDDSLASAWHYMQSVQVQEQQQQTIQSPQAEPEVSSLPTFLSEDTTRLDEEEVPEEISNRILRRIIVFAGLPTFLGMLSLPLFYYLKVHALGLPLTCLR